MHLLKILLALGLTLGMVGAAGAGLITPAGVTTGGGTIYHNSPSLLIDNVIPAEGTPLNDARCVWWGGGGSLVVDLGRQYYVQDIVVQVDHNDVYMIDYSVDNRTYTNMMGISNHYGNVSSGMDTMSTIFGDFQYISELDFAPVKARYLKIRNTSGNGSYSVSELQAFGNLGGNPAPLPAIQGLLLGSD